jgi:hypothetical protein
VVSQAANLVLDFSLMVAMSNFERGLRFANVLALTLLACGQIYDERGVTIQLVSDWVSFASISTFKILPLLQNIYIYIEISRYSFLTEYMKQIKDN